YSGKQLVRQTRSSYATPDTRLAIVCAVSKQHDVAAHPSYWFAFHPYQKTFLERATEGFLVLGCGSARNVLAIPAKDLFSWLPDMGQLIVMSGCIGTSASIMKGPGTRGIAGRVPVESTSLNICFRKEIDSNRERNCRRPAPLEIANVRRAAIRDSG